MDPAFAAKAFDTLIATGPVAVTLAIAVWWQTKGNQTLVTQLNAERTDRLDAMDDEIKHLRVKSENCERDRVELHKQIAGLLGRERVH